MNPSSSSRPSYSSEQLALVDEQGPVAGREKKDVCHQGPGLLHAAFPVIVCGEDGSLLLARRSSVKRLGPGFWDGTAASHYLQSADRSTRIRDKVQQELKAESVARHLFQGDFDKRVSQNKGRMTGCLKKDDRNDAHRRLRPVNATG